MRRVVTGHDSNGKAVVLSDGNPGVESSSQTRKAVNVWFTDATPAPLAAGPAETIDRPYSIVPSPGGTSFRLFELPPDEQAIGGRSPAEIKAAFNAAGGGSFSTTKADSPHPLMHRTETIDYGIVLEGEIFLLVDDAEVHLKQGDVIVQRGTNHAWSNRSGAVCRMAFVVVDGKFEPELAKALA
ncbi:MAG: putative Transcriptional regulator [Ramlibacter sp.]|nr:putative Transcriptional regulator [Ramlibacter sp.]